MGRTVLVALMSCAACADVDVPELPELHIVTWQDQPLLDEYSDGASVWRPLGFRITTAPSRPECVRDWYVQGDYDCTITIGVQRDPLLRERAGTNALSNRAERSIVIDSELTNAYDLTLAMAHEVGHIVLDTAEHTSGGVMGGASAVLTSVDYEFACRAIGVCL